MHGDTTFAFDILGLYNGSMLMKDREGQSLWSCYNGAALYGPLRGEALPRVPAYLCYLGEWLEAHPDSEILQWAHHPLHEDPRHGHGCWFHFGGHGQHPHALATMLDRELDDRLPERELVLGVCHPAGLRAYPLCEVHRCGHLLLDEIGGEPIAILSRGPGSSWMGAFSRELDDRVVQLTPVAAGRFRDNEGNTWTVEGEAIAGPLAGRRLRSLDFVTIKWNAWAGFYPQTEIYRPPEDAESAAIEPGALSPLLGALSSAGFEVAVTARPLIGGLPPAAREGLAVAVDGDPCLAFCFGDAADARDYADSRLLLPRDRFLSFFPGEAESDVERCCRAAGPFVLESDPQRQYADLACLERLPETEIAHARCLDDERLRRALDGLASDAPATGRFGALFGRLREAGFPVAEVKPMLRQWLQPDAVDGYAVSIAEDRFLVYRFADPAAAERYATERHHAARAGAFVLRSDPPGQYHVATEQTYNRPAEEVAWSGLLDDASFRDALG